MLQPAIVDCDVGAGRERCQEEQAAGGLGDVDEAAGAREPAAEAADVDVAVAVDLGHPEERLIEPAPS